MCLRMNLLLWGLPKLKTHATFAIGDSAGVLRLSQSKHHFKMMSRLFFHFAHLLFSGERDRRDSAVSGKDDLHLSGDALLADELHNLAHPCLGVELAPLSDQCL